MTVRIGDWVRVDSKGVWRIQRVVPAHYEPRYSLSDSKELYAGPLFLLKRIVNDKWKPAFEATAARGSLVKPLNKADSRKLQKFLGENDAVVADFDGFACPVAFTMYEDD
jgi:hypothetical protein